MVFAVGVFCVRVDARYHGKAAKALCFDRNLDRFGEVKHAEPAFRLKELGARVGNDVLVRGIGKRKHVKIATRLVLGGGHPDRDRLLRLAVGTKGLLLRLDRDEAMKAVVVENLLKMSLAFGEPLLNPAVEALALAGVGVDWFAGK